MRKADLSLFPIYFGKDFACTHCHTDGEWHLDELPPAKVRARSLIRPMWRIVPAINRKVRAKLAGAAESCASEEITSKSSERG